MRAPPVRQRFSDRGDGGRGLVGGHGNTRDATGLWHAGGGGRVRQGLPDPGRTVRRRGHRAALASVGSQHRLPGEQQRQQVGPLHIPRHRGPRGGVAAPRPLRPRRRRGDELHDQPHARTHAIDRAPALRHHRRRAGAEHRPRVRPGLLLRPPSGTQHRRRVVRTRPWRRPKVRRLALAHRWNTR